MTYRNHALQKRLNENGRVWIQRMQGYTIKAISHDGHALVHTKVRLI